jgi:hypothetical protein
VPRKRCRARQALSLPLAGLVLQLALADGAAASESCPRHRVRAAAVVAGIEAGRAAVLCGVEIRGDLRLPPAVDVPLILRDSVVLGDVVAAHTVFSRVVDLSETELRGRVDFVGARFDAPFVFRRARTSTGPASFALAAFNESALFGQSTFGGPADFSLASFDAVASFVTAKFAGTASFAGAQFGSVADFTTVDFDGSATFADARFGARADFGGARFLGGGGGTAADFTRARFEDGATFLLAKLFGDVAFSYAHASGDMDFEDARFDGSEGAGARPPAVRFPTARFFERASFMGASFAGRVSFDQAVVGELDLEGAELAGGIRLPLSGGGTGRIGVLRLDLDDADRVEGGSGAAAAQEAALALVERGARAEDDLETANDARLRRLTMARHRKGAAAEALDLSFNYGLWGYGVRPFHQLLAIHMVGLAGLSARWAAHGPERPRWADRARGAVQDAGDSIGAFLRLHPPVGGWRVVEFLTFKLLTAMLVLNAANVWPVSRDLIEAVF